MTPLRVPSPVSPPRIHVETLNDWLQIVFIRVIHHTSLFQEDAGGNRHSSRSFYSSGSQYKYYRNILPRLVGWSLIQGSRCAHCGVYWLSCDVPALRCTEAIHGCPCKELSWEGSSSTSLISHSLYRLPIRLIGAHISTQKKFGVTCMDWRLRSCT